VRFRTTSAVLIVAFALNACGSDADSPTAPTPPMSALPRVDPRPDLLQVPGVRWNLTTIQTAVTGPGSKVCWRNPDGTRIDWLMAVQRSGESVSFVYDVHNWPYDSLEHKGRVVGEHFIASSESQPGYFPCGGVQVEFVFEAEVSGQFSANGQALTATEVWTYKLTSGEAVSIAFDWVASRQ
jgi:hypothetical protein